MTQNRRKGQMFYRRTGKQPTITADFDTHDDDDGDGDDDVLIIGVADYSETKT